MFIRASAILVLGWLLLPGAGWSRAQDSPTSEYQLKAAYIYKFTSFVEWPASALPHDDSPFVIGILGDNPFNDDLQKTVAGKKILDHPIKVVPLAHLNAATNCHILFISSSEKNRLPEILRTLGQTSVLTVGEMERFTQAGGIINLTREGNKIRFEISDDAAKRAGLKISSKLLSLSVRPAH